MKIARPALERLSILCTLLQELEEAGEERISSTTLGRLMGIPPHTIRKDISNLDGTIGGGGGYQIAVLRQRVQEQLGLDKNRRVCIVGLGRLGSALINYGGFEKLGYNFVAGFDRNINKIELLRTDIPLYPSYEIVEVVQQKKIEIGVLAVPAEAAQQTADRLIEGGVKGIINFAPVVLQNKKKDVFVRNIFVAGELNTLSALITQAERGHG